jgi:cell division protease FtsH
LDLGQGGRQREYSERTAEEIDLEISNIIREAHRATHQILSRQRSHLERLAGLLLEKEVVDGEELRQFEVQVREDRGIAAPKP